MKNSLAVVVAMLMVTLVFGCNSSGGTKVGKGKGVPGPTGVVEVSEQEAALIRQGLEGNRAAAEDAAKELREEAAALKSAGNGVAKSSEASGEKAEVAATTPEAAKAAAPAAENSAGSEVQPANGEAKPAEQKSESAPKVEPLDEAQPTEDKKSEENAAPKKEGATGDPLLDRFRMEAERLAAGKEVVSLGPKKRCMACDDVSDTVRCLTCWGHHLKSAEHSPSPEGKAMCPQCHNEHEFQAEHREPPTVIVYDKNAPCASCREAHSTGPHCPHCPKAATDNMKVSKEGNLVSDPKKKAENQENKKE